MNKTSVLMISLVFSSWALGAPSASGQTRTLDETESLLKELTDAHGVPGFEGQVRDILRREWDGLLDDLRTDGLGNNRYVEWILEVARENEIPVQFESVSGYGEDGAELQRSAQGIPSVNIGIPTRYGHSQSGVIDRSDYDNTVRLVVKMIEKLSAGEVAAIREF